MGSGQSVEKKSPTKETDESPVKDNQSPTKNTKESPAKKTQESPLKEASSNEASPSASPANLKSPETISDVAVTPATPEASGDVLPNIAGLSISSTTPTKAPEIDDASAESPKVVEKVSNEDLALVEAVSKTLRDTTGGKSLEIVLSPAVKKVLI